MSVLTKAGRFGLYAVVTMARSQHERVSAGAVARAFGVSENHVAKVLVQLGRAGLITSMRGAGGGYVLARDPRRLTMLEVVECVQGPVQAEPMDVRKLETIRGVLAELAEHAYYTMKSVTIATLAGQADAQGESEHV